MFSFQNVFHSLDSTLQKKGKFKSEKMPIYNICHKTKIGHSLTISFKRI